MSATEIRKLLNLFESIMLTELTDKVKQQQFERLKRENSAKLSELVLQYNDLANKVKDINKKKEQELKNDPSYNNDSWDFTDWDELDGLVTKKDKIYHLIQKEKENKVPDDKIRMYIDLWDEYSQGFPPQFKDITKLSLDQIMQLTRNADFKKYLRGKKSRFFTDQEPNPDLDTLYNKNNLVIMKGDLREKCIRYGEGYSWCISRKDAQNLFFSYRMRLNEPMFYFVFDKDKPKDDKYHAMVIYVDKNGIYNVANAKNTGDKEMSWNEIISIQPKLNGLQNLFKHKPLSSEEKSDYDKYKNKVRDDVYQNFSLEEKYKYFKFGNKLTPKQQNDTPDDLIGVYAKLMPTEITKFTFDRIKSGDKRKVIADVIGDNSINAGDFAMTVLRTPWHMSGLPEEVIDKAHKKITTNAYNSYEYAKLILKNNNYNPELIPQEIIKGISTNAEKSSFYAEFILRNNDYNSELIPQEIIKGISTDADNSYHYAEFILRNNNYNSKLIPQEIIKGISTYTGKSYLYAALILKNNDYDQTLIPQEIIKGISSDADNSYEYAKLILKNNDYDQTLIPQEIIKGISTDADNSYHYAEFILRNNNYNSKLIPQEIIKGISTDAEYSYYHASQILKNNDYDQTLITKEIITTIKSDDEFYEKYKELIQQNESIDLTRLRQLSGII